MISLKKFHFKSIYGAFARSRSLSYIQGQSPKPGVREYFYYIDHQGMLFLDDTKIKNFTSCFKDKEFLHFFFSRLTENKTERYVTDFPFLSRCGVERNYVRCEDRPIVYTHIKEIVVGTGKEDRIYYNHVADLLYVKFQPALLCMFPKSGRVYHPAPLEVTGVGLVKSSLAMELSKKFSFGNGEQSPPTHFHWKNETYELSNKLRELIDGES